MADIPVREMVLYKHGVGFFVREGDVSGENIALNFRQEEINDVLKSLAVFDKSGGQVLGIHYQTPMDKEARLANSSIRLNTTSSLGDLLRDLRGRQATLTFETIPGTMEDVSGRIIGLETRTVQHRQLGMNDTLEASRVTILTDYGQVRVFQLGDLRGIAIQDNQSADDLSYFLDTSMTEANRRTVHLQLSAGDHQLVVYYVAPSPTWRVSYRLVAESDENKQTGKALLQGWGLFDNRLEEDLEDVRVTLVAGQPISFIYELYASRIPHRPHVQDEDRIAPGPIEYSLDARLADFQEDGAHFLMAEADDNRPEEMARSVAHYAMPRALAAAPKMSRTQVAQSVKPASEAKETGETFQYVVTAPVSVKRGESALVPIIGSEVSYERELLYNGEKFAKHPVAALRFKNTSGLTLERGPVTVVEDGDYRGEAVVSFTKEDNEVYLPYAIELGVRITEESKTDQQTTGLFIKQEYMVYDVYTIQQTTYTLENTTAKPVTVTIEATMLPWYSLFDTPAADTETITERRWRITVPARTKREFTQKQRTKSERREQLRNLQYQQLQQFMENRWIDRDLFDTLSEMLKNLAAIHDADAKIMHLITETKAIYDQQEQIRKNLGALQSTGQEATLRNRLLKQLENTQNRLEAIEAESNDLQRQIDQAEANVQEIIAGLGQKQRD